MLTGCSVIVRLVAFHDAKFLLPFWVLHDPETDPPPQSKVFSTQRSEETQVYLVFLTRGPLPFYEMFLLIGQLT